MAKGKHSAALFEVINSSKRPDRVAQSLSTPRWWFKGKQTPEPAPAAAPSFAEPEPTEPAPPPAPQARTRISAGGNSRSTVHIEFDREQQELTLRLRYTTVLVGVFVVGVSVALAYVVGRHLAGGPQVASGEPSHVQQLMQQAPRPGVADLPGRQHVKPIEAPLQDRPRHTTQSNNGSKPHDANPAPVVPAGVETSLPRVVGMNYVIVQSYPPQEQATAQKAMDFLNRNGVPCTIETVKDFNPRAGWICLVGTAGFVRIHGPECESYLKRIEALGEKFPSSKFDRFDPHTYKWKG